MKLMFRVGEYIEGMYWIVEYYLFMYDICVLCENIEVGIYCVLLMLFGDEVGMGVVNYDDYCGWEVVLCVYLCNFVKEYDVEE